MSESDTDVSALAESAAPTEYQATRKAGREALVVVFPDYGSLPLPRAGETVGRAWLAALGIEDTLVSASHLHFLGDRGGWLVADAGSRNGTWLNGKRLAPGERHALADTAVLLLGRQVMVYRAELVGRDGPDTHSHITAPYGLRAVMEQVRALGDGPPCHVLLEGETGTGKDFFAREIARSLGRPWAKTVRVDAGALVEVRLGSELFGRVDGAYEGATTAEDGAFVRAAGGTVLLESVDELPPTVQARLVGVLQQRAVAAVGTPRATPYDAQVIAMSRRSLRDEVERGRFREDLFHALAEVHIELPPLRERKEDIRGLARGVVQDCGLAIDVASMQPEAIERLLVHPWRRNLWELADVMAEIAEVAPGAFTREGVDRVLGSVEMAAVARTATNEDVLRVYGECGENEGRAARVLEMSRVGFRGRLRAARMGSAKA